MSSAVTIWILTREINQYYQEGEYFVAAYLSKPRHGQLTDAGVPQHRLRHVLNGGGRVDAENEWFWLREVSEGEVIGEAQS